MLISRLRQLAKTCANGRRKAAMQALNDIFKRQDGCDGCSRKFFRFRKNAYQALCDLDDLWKGCLCRRKKARACGCEAREHQRVLAPILPEASRRLANERVAREPFLQLLDTFALLVRKREHREERSGFDEKKR